VCALGETETHDFKDSSLQSVQELKVKGVFVGMSGKPGIW
jgi:hypothetical protein